jgi:hypothetical protein
MAFEVSYNLENEQQFWDGECPSHMQPPPTSGHATRELTRGTQS